MAKHKIQIVANHLYATVCNFFLYLNVFQTFIIYTWLKNQETQII